MFKDEADIEVAAGKGGDGCVSFRREKYVARGGPDGGDGGDGGNVVFIADGQVSSLVELVRLRKFKAGNGEPGRGRQQHGKRGADCEVRVPVGTLIRDVDKDVLLKDLAEDGWRVAVARGGKGGRGNKSFATATNQVPREFEPGQPGEARRLKVELKLMADVGLVGLPNAGKSTFLSRVSRARPKIASYPFTTLEPELGIVELSDWRRLVIADIPGLIEGAHDGTGLGHQFLRHIERCRVLLHLVDISTAAYSDTSPAEAYRVIRKELASFSPALAEKPEVVAGNKAELPDSEDGLAELAEAVGGPVHAISALTGEGVQELLEELASIVLAEQGAETEQP